LATSTPASTAGANAATLLPLLLLPPLLDLLLHALRELQASLGVLI
jgi:hypothetical protein